MCLCGAVLVILTSDLPVYGEIKKARELQAGVLHNDITSMNIKTPKEHFHKPTTKNYN